MRQRTVLACLATCVLCGTPAAGQSETSRSLRERFVVTANEGFGLEPAELVAGPKVTRASWSGDGRYALAVREQALEPVGDKSRPPRTSLVVWSQGARRSAEAWATTDYVNIDSVAWLTGSAIALVTIAVTDPEQPGTVEPDLSRLHYLLLRVDPSRSAAQVLARTPAFGSFWVQPCPARPLGVLSRTMRIPKPEQADDRTQRSRYDYRESMRVVRADGSTGPEVEAPGGIIGRAIQWSQEGALAYCRLLSFANSGEPRRQTWYAFDTRSSTMRQVDQPPPVTVRERTEAEIAGDLPVAVRASNSTVTLADTKRALNTLWLEDRAAGGAGRAMVSAECHWGALSPRCDAVLYVAKGALWSAPITKVTRQEFERLARQALMTDGKQAALAILMYIQDYDEQWPTADGFADKLAPYTGDPSVLAGFNYASPGDTLASVRDPANTLLGYIDGSGGRVNVYTDGHVRWVDH